MVLDPLQAGESRLICLASANSEALSAMAKVFLRGLLLSSCRLAAAAAAGAEEEPISSKLCDLPAVGGGVE